MKKQNEHASFVYLIAAVLCACGKPAPTPTPVEMTPEPTATMRLDGLTGVSVVPGTHQRLWLKNGVGVVDSDGKTVFSDGTSYDDMVALDADRIALITRNDGYVYQLSTHRLLNRFCYLPPDMQQTMPDNWQQSFVVGWDATESRIYVQPQTFDGAGRRVSTAQVGVFAADVATPLEWQEVGEPDMQAGGIAVQSRDRIWLGWHSTLYLYDATAHAVQKRFSLEVGEISALALDGDQLLVLDGQRAALSSVALNTLK